MSLDLEVLTELKSHGGDKQKLTEHYAQQMKEIQDAHGGSVGDVPTNPGHPYWKFQEKLRVLGRLK